MSGTELYSIVDGKKQDSHIHKDMLASKQGNSLADEQARGQAKAAGISDKQIALLFQINKDRV